MEFLEVPIFDDDIYKMLVRLALNVTVVLCVVLGCYRRFQKENAYVFTFLLLNIMVFFICFALKKLELGLGMALGLFAIFGIIRYRTDSIRVKEMTYLFVIVGIAVINALSNKKTSYVELAVTNYAIVLTTYLLERSLISIKSQVKQCMVYDKPELLAPSRRDELLADLRERTGLEVLRVKVSKIDLSKGTATITVYYPASPEIPA